MSVHVTRAGVWISAGIEVSLFVLPLRGHKTSYDTDGNSPPLVCPGESNTERHSEIQIWALRGLRKMRESHMIVCVTDRCSLASAKQAHLCEKKKKTEDLKNTSVRLCRLS